MGKIKTYTERVTVLFETEELERLRNLSREKGISVSGLIRMATKELLKGENRSERGTRS